MTPYDPIPEMNDAPRVRARSLRAVPWRLSDVVIAVLPLVALRVFSLTITEELPIPRWLYLLSTILGAAWMLLFPLAIARYRLGWFPQFPPLGQAFVDAVLAIPSLVVLWVILIVGATLWSALFGEPETERLSLEPIVRSRQWVVLVFFAFLAVVVAPISEEILFRGMIYNALRRRSPIVVAALIQAVMFGALHQYGWMQSAVAGMLGLFLAFLYEWRRSLVAPIVMHAAHNATVLTIALVSAVFVESPMLGIDGEPGDVGCRVTHVQPGSGADEAGLQAGDIVTAIDHQRVYDVQDVAKNVREKKVGESVMIEFRRDGRSMRTEAVLKRRE